MASDKPDPEVKSTPPANPIPILYRSQRRRPSSFDDFSDATSSDESSPIEPHTPGSSKPPFIGSASPSSSPILSALLGQSPSKSFPFNRTFQPKEAPADENEEYPEPLFQRSPVSHTRRATLTGLLSQQPQPSPDGKRDKGSAILRRLSMGGMFARPQGESAPPPTPAVTVSPTQDQPPQPMPAPTPRKANCLGTLGVEQQEPPRVPTPMGERILKGHFDGFN